MNRLLTIFAVIISLGGLLFLNFQIISGWFGANGPANLGSIEVSYVSIGRFLVDFGFSSWAPFWYLGFPFHVFYLPVFPFSEVLLNKFAAVELWQSYRLLTGAAFILAPVSLFFLGRQLTGRILGGVIASLLYSVGPTIFYFILPSFEVASDRMSTDFWDPRRFTILVRWGEGPHLFSLLFLPLTGVFFDRFLKEKNFKNLLLASVFLGLTALTNAIGFFAAILLIVSMTFAKFSLAREKKPWALKALLVVSFLSFGLITFWYNLTFIFTFFREGASSGGILKSLVPWGFLIAVGVGVILYLLIKKVIKDFAIASALLWFLILFAVVATYYLSAPPEESFLRIELLPQALRYNTEVDLSLALLLGVILTKGFDWLGQKRRLVNALEVIVIILIIAGAFFYINPFLETAQKSAAQVVDLDKTSEKKIALWLKDHIDFQKGERVFVSGNYSFYLNWFTNVWQLRGGLYQASTNFWPEHIYYQLANGTNAEIAMVWLSIINAKYAVITTPASKELYKEIKNPARFKGQVVYSQDGDIIYEIPLAKKSLAKAVSVRNLKDIKVPVKADDDERLFKYQKWLNESGNELEFKTTDFSTYQIKGIINPGEGILVQMTADDGWRAWDQSSKKGIKVGRDPMGYLLLYPKEGEVDIVLKHGKSLQVYLGYFITLATFAGILYFSLLKTKKNIKNIFKR